MNIETAKARLSHFLSEQVPVIELQFSPSQLEDRAKWLRDFAYHCDQLLQAVAVDSAQHVSIIKPRLLETVFADALDDADIAGELSNAAYDLTESLREEALEGA